MSCSDSSHVTCGTMGGLDRLDTQLALFSHTDVFVLPYGAAMTNVVFMSKGATVIETSPLCLPSSWPSKQVER